MALIAARGQPLNAVRDRPIDSGFGRIAPPLSGYGADALRIAAEPAFGNYGWRIDMHPLPTGCVTDPAAIDEALDRQRPLRPCALARVTATRLGPRYGPHDGRTTVRFLISGGEYLRLVNDLDWRLDR